MKGKLVRYLETTVISTSENIGIVTDYKSGYNIRKSWSDKRTLIDEPLIKVYWINSPIMTPETAKYSIMGDWNCNMNENLELFDPNIIVDEWEELSDDWYLASFFELID
jgi:hypothetical protein